MRLAIMQPYLFPYIGYFQLISAVDVFVIFDDVNFINRGWINRNYILCGGESKLLTMELERSSQNKLINQINVGNRNDKLLKTINHNYSKAPFYPQVFPIISNILTNKEKNLATFLNLQLDAICTYLDLYPKWLISSNLNKDNSLRGQDKILAICNQLEATHYINLYGGRHLYNTELFAAAGTELLFIRSKQVTYPQSRNPFVPNLSIIDVMMFNSPGTIRHSLLKSYELVAC